MPLQAAPMRPETRALWEQLLTDKLQFEDYRHFNAAIVHLSLLLYRVCVEL